MMNKRELKICLGAALFCIHEIESVSGKHDPKEIRAAVNREIPFFREQYKRIVKESMARKRKKKSD